MIKHEVLDYKLCFVDPTCSWAYFTSCELVDQWGDDWDNIPYEHNAGAPYNNHYKLNNEISHEILKVAFNGQVDVPCAQYTNSFWSVEQINNGDVPWLSNEFFTANKIDKIYAGATLREFIEFIRRNEGDVFVPLTMVEDLTFPYTEKYVEIVDKTFKGEF